MIKIFFVHFAYQFLFFFYCISPTFSQVTVEGYVYESGNRGFLDNVEIEVYPKNRQDVISFDKSDRDGHFVVDLSTDTEYRFKFKHDLFEEYFKNVSTAGKKDGEKIFLKVEIKRAPGYIFEITLAESRDDENTSVEAIKGARIEVYNNTKRKAVLDLQDYRYPDFKVNLKKGNHYTVLIRKKGFLAKRMEAFVDVEGCILCFEGIGDIRPGVIDNLTESNSMGTLLANVDLERATTGKKIAINNIYYDINSAVIKPEAAAELDKLVLFLKDNPSLKVELGSHTDARGNDAFNLNLSEKRALSAVAYITTKGDISSSRILAKGYGEVEIKNRCRNGVQCTEEEHRINRRTELKLVDGLEERSVLPQKSLSSMKQLEYMDDLIIELQNQDQIKVTGNNDVPSYIIDQIIENDTTDSNNSSEQIIEAPKGDNLMESSNNDVSIISNNADEGTGLIQSSVANKPVFSDDSESTFTLSSTLNGHKIVIMFSRKAIPLDHKIFRYFDDILVYKTPDGNSLYLTGDFDSEVEANKFLKKRIIKSYPNAYVISFVNGHRVN